MKKFIIAIISVVLLAGSALAESPSANLKQAVLLYKHADYQGCQKEMQGIILNDPGNIIAHYYLAISYAQLNNLNGAKKEYNSVISLDGNSQLASYAKLGLSYLQENSPEKLSVKKEVQTTDNKAIAKNEIPKQTENATPSQEEIAHAMAVLSKSGMNQNMDPNMMQLNALMGGNGGMGYGNNNSMNNMMPLMMMYQNAGSGKNPDPAAMQTIISNMMMNSMNSSNSNNGNNENY